MLKKFLSKETLENLNLLKRFIFNQFRTRELIYNKLYLFYFTYINRIKNVYEDKKKKRVFKLINSELNFLTEITNTEKLYNSKKVNTNDLSNGLYHSPLLSSRKLLNTIENTNDYHFIDIGSGLGVLIFYACLNYNYISYTGIELDNKIYELSKQNLRNKKLKKKKILLKNISAHKYILDHDKKYVIFFYNPFDIYILKKFLQNNLHLIKKNKSKILFQGASVQRTDRVFEKFNFKKKVIDIGLSVYFL